MAPIIGTLCLSGCSSAPWTPSRQHVQSALSKQAHQDSHRDPWTLSQSDIPAPVAGAIDPPPPRPGPQLETYSVVVNQVEIAELLFAMARDAKLNVDVHPDVRGRVTLNAINQTLPQILSRLARQVDLHYEFEGRNLVVTPDLPLIRHYTVDYVNMSRSSRATTSIATLIASTGRDPTAESSGSDINNNSTTAVVNISNNQFWDTLIKNVTLLVTEAPPSSKAALSTGKTETTSEPNTGTNPGSSTNAPSAANGSSTTNSGTTESKTQNVVVSASPEMGLLSVRATHRQHEKVRAYLDKALGAARRQVLIEATIAEVQLSDQYQQGINWSRMRLDGSGLSFQMQPQGPATLGTGAVPGTGPGGITFPGSANGSNLPGQAHLGEGGEAPSMGVLRYLNSTSSFGHLGAAVSLLQSFGKVKVLSSPKISVLNNQTAVLKVVDNRVYFTIGVQITPGTTGTAPIVTYTSKPNTIPVGFVMSVTPQIEDSGELTISVRPTISRIIGFVNDPSPALAESNVVSRIPEIQTRELESILKVASGDIAVMGGLMQESVDDRQDSIPGAGGIPLLGNLFKYRNDTSTKSELVIFLRPLVVRDASIEGDYRNFRPLLPGADFFTQPQAPALPRAWQRHQEAKP